jgi:DMSO/TMAO reductase YedYZ molybdopterin-dependent catalytic subunit
MGSSLEAQRTGHPTPPRRDRRSGEPHRHTLIGVHRRIITLGLSSLLLLLAGCAGATAPTAPPAATAPPAVTGSAAPVEPGSVRVTGAVREPGAWAPDRLSRLPGRSAAVTYATGRGPESHTVTGVPLSALLDQAGLTPLPGKHGELSTGVLVVGADDYRALLSYGEIVAATGDRAVLLATVQDGRPLARPRLVVPGDAEGARYVRDVVEVHVVNVQPGG